MGRTLADYEIIEVLGGGGMGAVYKARQAGLNRLVALKVMHPGHAAPEAFARFQREARLLGQLRHANIVRLLGMGRHGDQAYFAMDYIPGRPLSALIQEARTPDERQTLVKHLAVIARAIHYAHTRGIIHRDLKPSNVIVDPEGQPVIADFGLARELASEQTMTAPGAAVGTAWYLSPEQARGDQARIGPATDVYALGAMLYEVLTGRLPFEGSTAAAVLRQTLDRPPVPPRRVDRTVSRDLEAICLKCLEKRPPARYATAEALADDLERALAGEPITAWRGLLRRLPYRVRRRPWQTAATAAGVLLLIAAGVVYVGRRPAPTNAGPRGDARVTALATAPAVPRALGDLEAVITSYHNPDDVYCVDVSADPVWWGVGGGAYRMDLQTGEKLFYPLPGVVHAIARDSGGNVWFWIGGPGTGVTEWGRAVRFDGTSWRTFTEEDGFECGRGRSILVDHRGWIWFCGRNAASYYDGAVWRTLRWAEDNWFGLVVAGLGPDGVLWFVRREAGTAERGPANRLWRFDGQVLAQLEPTLASPSGLGPYLLIDRRRRLWVTGYSWAACFDGRTWRKYGRPDGLAGDRVRAMTADKAGRIWFATDGGVSCLDGDVWQTYTRRDGLPTDDVSNVVIDHLDRKWFFVQERGEQGQGVTQRWLVRLDETGWQTFDMPPVQDMSVAFKKPSVDRQNRLWVHTRRGLWCFDNGQWQVQKGQMGGPNWILDWVAVDSRGVKWFTGWGVYTFDGRTWERFDTPFMVINPSGTSRIAIDKSDTKWFASSSGIKRLDGGGWALWRPVRFGVPRQLPADVRFGFMPVGPRPERSPVAVPVALLVDDQSVVWHATRYDVCYFKDNVWHLWEQNGGWAGSMLRDMALDRQGRKWFASDAGLSCFDGREWRTFSEKDGLSASTIYQVEVGVDGTVWVSTAEGLSSFKDGTWNNYRDDRPTSADRPSGPRHLAIDHAGRAWISALGGGTACFDGATWKTWTSRDFLAGDQVTCLGVDLDGSVWACTRTGVSHIVLRPKE